MNKAEEIRESIRKLEEELIVLESLVQVEDREVARIKLSNSLSSEFNDPKHFYCNTCGKSWVPNDSTRYGSIRCDCGGIPVRKSKCTKCGQDYEHKRSHWGSPDDVVCFDCYPRKKYLIIYNEDFDSTADTEFNIWHYVTCYPIKREESCKPGGYKIRHYSDYYHTIHTVPVQYVLRYAEEYGKYDQVYYENDLRPYQLAHLLDDREAYTHKNTVFKMGSVKVQLFGGDLSCNRG